jgi:hypothetical protein
MNAELKLGGPVYLRILNEEIDQGFVKINGNLIEDFPFSGVYFANIPIQLEVQSKDDYVFKSWGNRQDSTEIIVNIAESDTLNLFLEFEQIESSIKTEETVEVTFEISENYPNPFNAKTNIKIFSNIDTEIEIDFYNVNGQLVTSRREKINSGYNTINWDARNESGYPLPSGIYLYSVSDPKCRIIKKMTVLR